MYVYTDWEGAKDWAIKPNHPYRVHKIYQNPDKTFASGNIFAGFTAGKSIAITIIHSEGCPHLTTMNPDIIGEKVHRWWTVVDRVEALPFVPSKWTPAEMGIATRIPVDEQAKNTSARSQLDAMDIAPGKWIPVPKFLRSGND